MKSAGVTQNAPKHIFKVYLKNKYDIQYWSYLQQQVSPGVCHQRWGLSVLVET